MTKVLGVVMAGGRNVRYGGLKAFADVGGRRIVDRVIDALRFVSSDIVVIANDVAAYAPLGLPIRSDEVSTGAALAGLLTALHWSAERGCEGVVAVACDMPFANASLLQRLLEVARAQNADLVAPESGGRRGIEPLCAYYRNTCAPAIERAIAHDDLRMISFHDDVRAVRLPLDEVLQFGQPSILFMNVNTPEDLVSAQRIAVEQL
jgi:molybdopterin-guanine dinucleotide biosynthesis protein A